MRNGKLFRINAVSNDDLTVKGMGRLVTSNEDGSIYQITARTTKELTFFVTPLSTTPTATP